jgi:hypothetical protein
MGRFSFQTEIHGAGGFAKVIRGKDNTLDRDIAVKVLSSLLEQSTDADPRRLGRKGAERVWYPFARTATYLWGESRWAWIQLESVNRSLFPETSGFQR